MPHILSAFTCTSIRTRVKCLHDFHLLTLVEVTLGDHARPADCIEAHDSMMWVAFIPRLGLPHTPARKGVKLSSILQGIGTGRGKGSVAPRRQFATGIGVETCRAPICAASPACPGLSSRAA